MNEWATTTESLGKGAGKLAKLNSGGCSSLGKRLVNVYIGIICETNEIISK